MTAPLSLKPHARSFARWAKQHQLHDWRLQLALANDTLTEAAAAAGIDWCDLQQQLPPPATLIKGRAVPSLTVRDQGRNAFIWHLNTDRDGGIWASLLFMSFRHGGVHQLVHLRRWAWDRFNQSRGLPLPAAAQPAAQIRPALDAHEQEAEARRARRVTLAEQRWQLATAATPQDALLQRRLQGDASAELLQRLDLVRSQDRLGTHLMLRLQQPQHGHTGFQQIYDQPLDAGGRTQHLLIRQAGLKKGSFASIQPCPGHEHWPVALCEGLFTALSVALAWPGPLAVALDAYNLRHVRAGIDRPCVFFADDDRAGERHTGWHQARAALQPGDRIVLPQFAATACEDRLSDFNDLHRVSGLREVQRQVRQAWPQPVPRA